MQVISKNDIPSSINASEVILENQRHREQLLEMGFATIPEDLMVVNRVFFQRFPDLISKCQFVESDVDYHFFKKTLETFQENAHTLEDLPVGRVCYINSGLKRFSEAIKFANKVLLLDYGSLGGAFQVRYYGMRDDKSDPFIDVTTDVDFSMVNYYFHHFGFELSVYGHQSILLNKLSVTPQELVDSAITRLALAEDPRAFQSVSERKEMMVCELLKFVKMDKGFMFIQLERKPKPCTKELTLHTLTVSANDDDTKTQESSYAAMETKTPPSVPSLNLHTSSPRPSSNLFFSPTNRESLHAKFMAKFMEGINKDEIDSCSQERQHCTGFQAPLWRTVTESKVSMKPILEHLKP